MGHAHFLSQCLFRFMKLSRSCLLTFLCFSTRVLPFRAMTLLPESSPNCVRSLEAQLQATTLEMSKQHPVDNACTSTSRASPRASRHGVSIPAVRNLIFQLSAVTGSLSSLFLRAAPPDVDEIESMASAAIATAMAQLLNTLLELSCSLSINLHTACCKKIELNGRKYPVELCKVSRIIR